MDEIRHDIEKSLYVYKATVLRVVDGDTIELDIDLGLSSHVHEKVRLHGIDTPEVFGVKKDSEEYEAGKRASNWVRDILFDDGKPGSKQVWISTMKDKTGKYGRYVVDLWLYVDGKFECLNELLVEEGLAERVSY